MIYFDNSATTKPFDEVLETFTIVSKKYFANPSSLHKLGAESERLLNQARRFAAELLLVEPNELIFTSSGTEGNQLAIKGAAYFYQHRGKHIITTQIEHPSVLEACKQLEKEGFEVTYLPVQRDGRVAVEEVEKAIREDTILVSMIHVNNETGTIQPIEAIGSIVEEKKTVIFHVDHVQGFAKVPLHFKKANIDLCTMSGHKIHGLKGTGMLYVRKGVKIEPLFTGGGQEFSLRAGTENVPGIVALVKALRLSKEKYKENRATILAIEQYMRRELEAITGVYINSPIEHHAKHILNVSFTLFKPETIVHALDEKEIYVSTKSACSSKGEEKSHVLAACGLGEMREKSSIRFSFSYENTLQQAKTCVDEIRKIVKELQEV
ncbi:MAG TPA: cysteine desulfurase family protein [Massilibacterium sp.]|nr:cysteine desulfurase family protein [Massilibacterium sp.]